MSAEAHDQTVAMRARLARPRPGVRIAAALASLAIVALLLHSLRDAQAWRRGESARRLVAVALPPMPRRVERAAPPKRSPAHPTPPVVAREEPAASRLSAAQSSPHTAPDIASPAAAPSSMRSIRVPSTSDPEPPIAAAPPPAAGASSSLRLDDRTLRIAGDAGEPTIRRMARRSGQVLDTPRPTTAERLAAGVAQAGVPNCLAPDGLKHDPPRIGPLGLGGVLAVPFVAHAAITGRCKP